MPRDKRSALWDSSEGRGTGGVQDLRLAVDRVGFPTTRPRRTSTRPGSRPRRIRPSRGAWTSPGTREKGRRASANVERNRRGEGDGGRRDRTTTEDRAAGDAIASRVVILGRTGQSAVSVMLTPLFASCDAAAHTHATVTASASAPSNRMVAHRRVALCRSSRRRTRARTRLAWTTRGETRRLPRSVDLRNERCPCSMSPLRAATLARPPLTANPLLLPLPSAPSLSPIHPPPPPTRRNTPRAEGVGTSTTGLPAWGQSWGNTSTRPLLGAHTPLPPASPPNAVTPTLSLMGSVGSRTRSNSTVSPPRSHVARYRQNVCVDRPPVSSSHFRRSTCGASRPPGSGYRRNRMRGRTTARARARGGHRFETHRRRRCLVRWRARGPRGPTRRRRRIGSSTRRCTPTSAPPRGPPPSVPPPPRGTVPEDRRPRTSPPTPLGTSASTLAGTGSRVVRGARSRDEREVGAGRKGSPPSPSPTCRAPEEIEAPTPRAPPTPLASVRGGPHRVHWRARRTTPSPRPAPPPRGRRPLARVRAPSPPDPATPRRRRGRVRTVRGVHVGTRGDERANRRDVTQRGGGS